MWESGVKDMNYDMRRPSVKGVHRVVVAWPKSVNVHGGGYHTILLVAEQASRSRKAAELDAVSLWT